MALPPALSKLNVEDMKTLRRATEGLLEYGITKVDNMDKLQDLMEVVRKFGINKVDDMDDLKEKLAKNIQKQEKPVKQEYKEWIGKVDLPESYEQRGCRIKDTAERGISLHQLQDLGVLIEKVLAMPEVEIKDREGKPQTREIANLYVINSYFVEPLTWKDQISFVELVAESVQVPLWFISHWWGTPFHQTLQMLGLHNKTRELQQDSFYWMCTFANNQHELEKELGGELSDTPFLRVLRSDACSGTVALMDGDATPFSRIWCVLEAFEAMELKLPYDMGAWIKEGSIFRGEKKCAAQASLLLDDKVGTITCEEKDHRWPFPFVVAKAAAKTEVKNANSSREADKTLILHYIDGREEELDKRIHQRMSETALNAFILDGNSPMTEKLLHEFPDLLNEPLDQSNGSTPTHVAALGHLECLRLLIDSRGDVDRSSTGLGATPTLVAAELGHVKCLELLIASRADIEKSTHDTGSTPIFMAAQKGHVECLKLLIASRADIDRSTKDTGSTPILIAAEKGKSECLKLLVASRADVDKSKKDTGTTPTFMAAQEGHLHCLKLLLASRADINKGTKNTGATPTLIAAEQGRLECLRLLIASRSDVDESKKDTGSTPMLMAAQKGHLECLELLIASRADVEKSRENDGATPTFIAVATGHLDILRLLIASRADLEKRWKKTGPTALMYARSQGHKEIVQELLRAGAMDE